jgi:hypothetical protein
MDLTQFSIPKKWNPEFESSPVLEKIMIQASILEIRLGSNSQ